MGDQRDTAALVGEATAGSQGAWDALVERFAGLVWAVVRSNGLYGEAAADVFQTTWLRAVEHLDRVREPDRLGAWLATTARHESLRVLRRSSRTVAVPEVPEPHEHPGVDLDAGLLAGERHALALTALAVAPPRCQQLLRLLVAEPPLSYDEISTILGMPKGSIGPTRARCLEHVRGRLRARRIRGPGEDS